MDKLNTNAGSMEQQMTHYRQRVQQLEDEQVKAIEEKSDLQYEIRRLTEQIERVENSYQ